MTQELIDLTMLGINQKRNEIVKKMAIINKKYEGKAIYYDNDYRMLVAELQKLDYQALEIKEQVSE